MFTFLLLLLLLQSILGIVEFKNENNMYSCIAGPGNSTDTLIYVGLMKSLQQCESAFSNVTGARSFVYYDNFEDEDWNQMCYVRTDTYWYPVQQDNVISGQTDNFNQCQNDLNCELNGQCKNGKCECKPAWTGEWCQFLNFKPGSKDLGYQREDYSQWGSSSIYDKSSDTWVAFAVEMVNQCGINACCGPNSQIVKVTSPGNKPGGPYTRDSVAVPYFAHEPMVVYEESSKQYLLYHWGNGDQSDDPVTGCKDGYTNGPPPKNINADDSMETFISYADSLDGPWKEIIIPDAPNRGKFGGFDELCLSNPYFYENGSLLMVWTQRLSWDTGSEISLVTGDAWNKNYNFRTSALWTTALLDDSSMEDPFLWRDADDDTFHILMHGMIEVENKGGNPWLRAAQGRHAYSTDGLNWNLSPHYTYNTTICYDDGDCIDYARRERPHLIFDPDSGEPLFLTNGIQLNNLLYYDKTFNGAVPLYTSSDYCKMGKTDFCK